MLIYSICDGCGAKTAIYVDSCLCYSCMKKKEATDHQLSLMETALRSRSWENVDEDGPEMSELSTAAAQKIRQLAFWEGKSPEDAEAGTQRWLDDLNVVPSRLVEIAVAEAMAMMPWTWGEEQEAGG